MAKKTSFKLATAEEIKNSANKLFEFLRNEIKLNSCIYSNDIEITAYVEEDPKNADICCYELFSTHSPNVSVYVDDSYLEVKNNKTVVELTNSELDILVNNIIEYINSLSDLF